MTDVEETEVTVEDEESEDEAPNAPSELDSSEDEFSEDVARLGISRQEVEANQLKMGEEVEDDKPSLNLLELREKYPEAFTQESETCLSAVLEDLQLPYKLTDYQAQLNDLILFKFSFKLDYLYLICSKIQVIKLVIGIFSECSNQQVGCHASIAYGLGQDSCHIPVGHGSQDEARMSQTHDDSRRAPNFNHLRSARQPALPRRHTHRWRRA